jgi:hypothetical protein
LVRVGVGVGEWKEQFVRVFMIKFPDLEWGVFNTFRAFPGIV